jgi:phage shock protein PspC (stress-responsive transcriptional regulator)
VRATLGDMSNSLFIRPVRGRVVAGVCAAIANHYAWDVSSVRLAMAFLGLFTGVGVVLYVALWIAIPSQW